MGGRGGDDKKPADAKKDSGGGNPLGKIGGALGNVGSKLPFGKSDDTRKDPPKPGAKKDDKKDAKKEGGGLFSKLPSFGNRGDDAKKDDKKPGSSAPGSSGGSGAFGSSASSSSSSSPLGGSSRPAGSGYGSGAPGGGSPMGGAKPGAKPDKPGAKKDAKGGRGGPLGAFRNLFGSRTEKPRRSAIDDKGRKTAEVKPISLSFDKRMELIGIFMMISGLVLLLSSLSPTQGSIPYTINSFLSKLFGFGAIAVPIAMLPVGLWMVMLRAGEETPLVDMQRIVGLLMLYVGALTLFQYYDALSYPPGETQTYQSYLQAMRDVLLPLSAEFGRGGGRVGGEIYYQLISNIGEIGGFVVVIGWLVVAIMFTLSLSARDISVFVVSVFRSFSDAQTRRRQRRLAIAAEREAKRTADAVALSTGIAVTTDALPAGKAPALPAAGTMPLPTGAAAGAGTGSMLPLEAATPEERRSIPITMGGRTYSAPFRPGDPVPVEGGASSAEPPRTAGASLPVPPMRADAPAAAAKPVEKPGDKPEDRKDEKSGLFGRIRGAVGVGGAVAAGAAIGAAKVVGDAVEGEKKDTADDKKSGGLFGRLPLTRPGDKKPDAGDDKKMGGTVTAPAASAAPPVTSPGRPSVPPLPTVGTTSTATTPAAASPAAPRPSGIAPSPFSKPGAPAKPPAADDELDDDLLDQEEDDGFLGDLKPTRPAVPPLKATPAAKALTVDDDDEDELLDDEDDDADDKPPARLGDLVRGTTPSSSPGSGIRPSPFAPKAPGTSGTSGTPAAASGTGSTPAGSPARPAGPSPSPFGKPPTTAKPTIIDDDDDLLDDEEGEGRGGIVRSSAVLGAKPVTPSPSPFGAKPSPLSKPPVDEDDDEDDDLLDEDDLPDEDEPEDWKNLPPARPKSTSTTPAVSVTGSRPLTTTPGSSTTVPLSKPPAAPLTGDKAATPPAASGTGAAPASNGDSPSASDGAPIPDLQTRLAALRSMQNDTSAAPATDKPAVPAAEEKKPDEKKTPEPPKSTSAFGRPDDIMAGDGGRSYVPPSLTRPTLGDRPQTPAPPSLTPTDAPRTPASTPPPGRVVTPATTLGSEKPTPIPHGTTPQSPPPPARTTGTTPPARPEPVINPPAPAPVQTTPAAASAEPGRKGRKEWKMVDMGALLSTGTDQEMDHNKLIERAHTIEDTLSSFGAPGRVVEVRTGPVITQFGVEPDYISSRGGKKNRVKVSAIAALDKDLQLALGAKSIRIEAPVPGKGYVGIEVPNDQSTIVRLRDVMESPEFRKYAGSPLAIALGQGVDGTPVAADLTSMPHLLIAGTTGSGKSICVNSIIASLLIRNSPDRVKFIMVDPKRVELTGYNGVPHLVAPVVVELERIVSVLKWVTREMDERYRRFANAAARNIEDFNRHLPAGEPVLPYIVVIIDELADLMMLAPDDTERLITRIAALARATGIHLVIATQRPSVDVVTGLIKANFPARIAFAVAGSVDSRVILDQPGAERLLGRGDMLYMSGDSPAPQRLQGVYVSDNEINNITRFWRSQVDESDLASQRPILSSFAMDEAAEKREVNKSWSPTQANRPAGSGTTSGGSQQILWDRESTGQSAGRMGSDEDGDTVDDALYEQAVDLVRRLNKASVSLLQRRLRIGYTRAARLIDIMEERGIVGPPVEGSKPRDVLPPK